MKTKNQDENIVVNNVIQVDNGEKLFKNVKYDADAGLPSMYSYNCERCLKPVVATNYDEEDVKEIFDYKCLTGFALCPSCRDEFEHMKSKAYKVTLKRRYETQMGELKDVDIVFKEDRAAVVKYLDMKESELRDMMALGYILKDIERLVEYVPYGERFNID